MKRTVEGVTLTSQGNRQWVSDDGVYLIEYVDDYETECDAPHPMRLPNGKGTYCPGNEIHYYGMWEVAKDGDLIGREDTFKYALGALREFLTTGKITV